MSTGKIIVITAPSGSGKTTLVKWLLASCEDLAFSVSASCFQRCNTLEIFLHDLV